MMGRTFGERDVGSDDSRKGSHGRRRRTTTGIINHWYGGRGASGSNTFLAAQIVHEKKFHYDPVTALMLAKDGRVIADDQDRVTFAKSAIGGGSHLGQAGR